MPRSKHRRKAGGKAVRNPGRAKVPNHGYRYEVAAWDRFTDAYTRPFNERHPDDDDAGYMLGIIAENAFTFDRVASLGPVSRADAITEFVTFEADDEFGDPAPPKTAAGAEAALARLVEHGMIELDGDQIIIPERFLSETPTA
jgi:hypothetical protein